MTDRNETLKARLTEQLGDQASFVESTCGEVTIEIAREDWFDAAKQLRDGLGLEVLVDVCGVDYLSYGSDEWKTRSATDTGYSRGVQRDAVILDEADEFDPKRFAAVYHLLSIENNVRLRVRVFCGSDNPPILPSVVDVWSGADWFEREAFDLFGILFEGHPDLRRILTDYGFIGHPFRKDFPLIGNVEVSYDEEKGRVAYQPVSIESRTLVPRVIRDDNRYSDDLKDNANG
ncbi:MAG: NADH-quinone oxidoreductase subunit C [Woeseiaceae bacterium]|nr:NADH-quinone oxidoreductase subunit C [Woeseiaceae bacterium]